MELLYKLHHGWHYMDDEGNIKFIATKEEFNKLKEKGEK